MTDLNIDFSGDTITLVPYFDDEYNLLGSGTLLADYIVTFSGTVYNGFKLIFYFKATVDKDSYQFNILGTNLSTTQLNRESTIVAVYNGTSWDLNITPNTQAEEWLVPSDFADNRNLEVVVIPVSFETG